MTSVDAVVATDVDDDDDGSTISVRHSDLPTAGLTTIGKQGKCIRVSQKSRPSFKIQFHSLLLT